MSGVRFVEVYSLTIIQVNEAVLKKVIEWCEHHKNDPQSATDDDDNRRKTTDIDEWDQKFMQVDQEMLFEIILVSSALFPSAHHVPAMTTRRKFELSLMRSLRLPITSISRLSSMSAARLWPT